MKQKAKNALKHKVEVAGKTIPTMIIVGLFLVGGGSAALLSTYGSVSGTADVEQAVHFAGGNTEVTSSFDGSLVAGQTTSTEFTLVNDASREAPVELVSDAEDIAGIEQVVKRESYDTQSYDLKSYRETPVDASDLGVTVDPDEDSVSYTADFLGYQNTDSNKQATQLYFTHPDQDSAAHVYVDYGNIDSDGYKYGFKNSSVDKTYDSESALVSAHSEIVESMNYDESSTTLSVTVDRPEGYNQSFAVVDPYQDSAVATVEWADKHMNGESISESKWFTDVLHESVDYETRNFDDPVTVSDTATGTQEEVSLDSGTESDFRVLTDFHVALDPSPTEVDSNPKTGEVSDQYFDEGSYLVDLEVQPSATTP